MQYKGAVFFDYDGTLADGEIGIPLPTEATKNAIAAFQKKGYLAILATGRAKSYVYDTGVNFDGMVTSNGTFAEVGGEVIYDHPIGDDLLIRLRAELDRMGIAYGIDNPERCYTPDIKSPVFQHWLNTFAILESSFRNIEPGELPRGYKLSVLFNAYEEIDELREKFGKELSFDCQRVFKCADVNILGFNKSSGVKAICEHFNLPIENTYAFGDGMNDYGMLECVGHGIAMGHHAEALEECAEFITRTVQEEGIEYGLKHYGLID